MMNIRKVKHFLSLLLLSSLSALTSCNSDQQVENTESIDTEDFVQTPLTLTYNVVGTLWHDSTAFTQGLEYYKEMLYESTGLEGQTSLSVIDPETGKVIEKNTDYRTDNFGEGLTILEDRLFQLTLQNNIIYQFDPANIHKVERTFNWPKEGWGLSNDGESLIISDGSSSLYFVEPSTMDIKRTIRVNDNRGAVDQLNELEFIDGYIYANRWHSDDIYKIDPENGNVVGILHFGGVLKQYAPGFEPGSEDVLNGIAWDEKLQVMYVTGKNWPLIFKVEFLDQNK